MFLLDGSALELEHGREPLKSYPPGENGRRQGHWPVLRIVVMHDVGSRLAQTHCWGPMYGAEGVSKASAGRRSDGTVADRSGDSG